MAGIVSTTANYGGKVDTQQGNIKQFIFSSDTINWVYKRLTNILTVITPVNPKKYPIYLDSDLIVTGSIFNPSDERIKDNINTIDDERIDNLLTLNPIIFSYKNDIKKKKHFGILAQDIEKLYPEIIENNIMLGHKSVNYIELMPLMLAKMKKMEDEINELKQTLKITS
jgi:hypothetical protein